MTKNLSSNNNYNSNHLMSFFLTNRVLRHVTFWLIYYLFFSLIWVKPDLGYLSSFYLEFILLPIRIMAAYTMMYWLIPQYLVKKQYQNFAIGYLVLLITAGCLQRLFDHFFYQQLMLNVDSNLLNITPVFKSIILVNTTIILAAVYKVFQLFLFEQQQVKMLTEQLTQLKNNDNLLIELKSNRRTHHIKESQILYIEGMGNYVNYYLENDEKITVYSSIKAALEPLPAHFIRLHRSYIINTKQISSYNHENVNIRQHVIPRGADITDEMLTPFKSSN